MKVMKVMKDEDDALAPLQIHNGGCTMKMPVSVCACENEVDEAT